MPNTASLSLILTYFDALAKNTKDRKTKALHLFEKEQNLYKKDLVLSQKHLVLFGKE